MSLRPSKTRVCLVLLFITVLVTNTFLPCYCQFTVLSESIALDLVARNLTSKCSNHVCAGRGRGGHGRGPVESWEKRGCFCDNECAEYGDCCLDAARFQHQRRPIVSSDRGDGSVTCRRLRHYDGFYMVSSCSAGFNGSQQVRQLCEAATALPLTVHSDHSNLNESEPSVLGEQDPLLVLPVTDRSRRATFSNIYCALCNDRHTDHVQFWSARLECPDVSTGVDQQKVRQQVIYNKQMRSWVLVMDGGQHRCTVHPVYPEQLQVYTRRCRLSVDTCPADFPDSSVVRLCGLYTAFIYDGFVAYRNRHCALCNGVEVGEELLCSPHLSARGLSFDSWLNEFNQQAFSLLYDFNFRKGSGVGEADSDVSAVGFNCEAGRQVWDPFFHRCRDLVCDNDAGYELKDGKCEQVRPPVTSDTSVDNNTDGTGRNRSETSGVVEAQDDDELSEQFERCTKIVLLQSEFVLSENGTALVPLYENTVLLPDQYRLINRSHGENDGVQLSMCVPQLVQDKFSVSLTYLSTVCLVVSIVCLCLHMVAVCFAPELRNLSGKNLSALCLCLLTAHISFLSAGSVRPATTGCRVVALFIYTGYIAALSWMNVMAFDVFLTLRRATRELRVSSGDGWRRFLSYSAYVSCVTGILLAITLAADQGLLAEMDHRWRPRLGRRTCWFNERRPLVALFGAPLLLMMIASVLLFCASVRIIRCTTSAAAAHSCTPSQVNLRLYSRLAIIMGVSWCTALLAGWLSVAPLWYLSVVLNTLQGLFIFVSFTCTAKVRRRVRERLASMTRTGARSLHVLSAPRGRTGKTAATTAAAPRAALNHHMSNSLSADTDCSQLTSVAR